MTRKNCFLTLCWKGTLLRSGVRWTYTVLSLPGKLNCIWLGQILTSASSFKHPSQLSLSWRVTHPPLCSCRSNMVWAHHLSFHYHRTLKKPGADWDSGASISSSLYVPLWNQASGESRRLLFHSVISAHMWGQANYPLLHPPPLEWTGWNVGGMLGTQHVLWKSFDT